MIIKPVRVIEMNIIVYKKHSNKSNDNNCNNIRLEINKRPNDLLTAL